LILRERLSASLLVNREDEAKTSSTAKSVKSALIFLREMSFRFASCSISAGISTGTVSVVILPRHNTCVDCLKKILSYFRMSGHVLRTSPPPTSRVATCFPRRPIEPPREELGDVQRSLRIMRERMEWIPENLARC